MPPLQGSKIEIDQLPLTLQSQHMQKIKHLWSNYKWLRRSTYVLVVLIILFLLRTKILVGIGDWLDASETPQQTEACFILGGNSFERGLQGVEIHRLFPTQRFVATGGNYPLQIQALDTMMTEAQLTRHIMTRKGVPGELIEMLQTAHSTMDESEEILTYCQTKGIKNITVVSSSLHLKRVSWVFNDKFEQAGITVHYTGAEAVDYNFTNWWKNEEGLIMVNNELVKLVYYAIKY
jgi:uncharacterized SAM-binding protein YcdF (DUF218 family)